MNLLSAVCRATGHKISIIMAPLSGLMIMYHQTVESCRCFCWWKREDPRRCQLKRIYLLDNLQGPQASVANSFQDNPAKLAKHILQLREKIRPLCKNNLLLSIVSSKLDQFLNHFRVRICESVFDSFTTLFPNSAHFLPFLATDFSGRSLFYSVTFELCGRTFGQLATATDL